VVDEDGGTDLTRVHHTEPHTLVLKGKPTEVKFQMDCEEVGRSDIVLCNGEGNTLLLYKTLLYYSSFKSLGSEDVLMFLEESLLLVHLIRNTVKQ